MLKIRKKSKALERRFVEELKMMKRSFIEVRGRILVLLTVRFPLYFHKIEQSKHLYGKSYEELRLFFNSRIKRNS